MEIADKMIVSLRYVMKNNKGEELENIMGGLPVSYLHGSGNILPALEAGLAGLKTGEKKSLSISGEMEQSVPGNDFHFDVIIDEVRMATENEIQKGKPIWENEKNECGPGCCR